MTQTSVPSGSSLSSKLKQPKYIIAIAIIIIVILSTVAVAYYLSRPAATSPYKIVTGTSPQIRYLVFNVNKVTDPRIRQAMAYAVDRAAIISSVFFNQTQPLYSMVPAAMPYSKPVFQTTYGSAPNLTKADALLTQAGYSSTSKLSIDLWYNSDGHYGDTEPTVALVLKTSIEKTGMVIVNLKSEPWAQFVVDRKAGVFPFFLLGWYPDYFDSDDYVSPFLTTSGAQALGSFYSNSTMSSWITGEQQTVNDTTRTNLFSQIQNKLATDIPYLPLWQGSANIGYKSDISGVVLHPVVFKYDIMSRSGTTQLNVGTTDSVVCLDPACAYDYFSIEVINQVFDTLLIYAPNSTTLLPGLATQVPSLSNGGISTDGVTYINYTYHLRTGVKFSDGTPFNATVMKWSLERVIALGDPATGNNNYAGGKYGVSAAFLLFDVGGLGNNTNWTTQTNDRIIVLDPYTIRFHLNKLVSFFNELMAFSVSAPVSMSAYSKTAGQPDTPVSKIVGTGPYIVSSYTPSQSVVLTNNANYYGSSLYSAYGYPTIPTLTKVSISFSSDATGLKNALLSGQIDMAYRTLNPQDITSLARQYGS